MPEPGDRALIECPRCGKVYAGRISEEGKLVAVGGPECPNCGNGEFEVIAIGDKRAEG